MAVITAIAAVNVRRILANRYNAIVTRTATADNLRVVYREYRRKHIRRVAIFAHIAALYVYQVFADRLGTVVTAHAIAADIDVIEIRRQPADRGMTVIADNAAGNVCRVFAGCGDTVMTGTTGTEYLSMVNQDGGFECHGAVAVFADVRSLHMRRAFAGSACAVVATDAISCNAAVIEDRRNPGGYIVAVITLVVRRYVSGCFPGSLNAIVTACTAAG